MHERMSAVLNLIDLANAQDPNRHELGDRSIAKELLYGERMSEALMRLDSDPSEELQIAVRAQHLERWRIPRDSYPRDRVGYLKWRTELSKLHATRAEELMRQAGYEDESVISRVSAIIQKKKLRQDPESQTLEDCACLVFLQYHFDEFVEEHPRDKVIDIVRKTWNKMSDRGHQAALALSFTDEQNSLIQEALAT